MALFYRARAAPVEPGRETETLRKPPPANTKTGQHQNLNRNPPPSPEQKSIIKHNKMSQRRIDLSQLEPQEIIEIRKSTEQEIQHFTQSLQALQTAQLKLQDCISTIDSMDASEKSELLVPMTSSLYLPGTIKEKGRYLVDIGTGYFVEKSSADAKLVYQKKHAKLEGDSKKLKDILVQKNDIMNNINMVLRKIMLEQDNAAQKQ